MNKQEYIPVELAREQLGISPTEMSVLLEAGALCARKGPQSETIQEVRDEEVRDAVKYLVQYRQEEKARINQLVNITKVDNKADSREILLFNLSDTDLMTLLLAFVSYFDVERNISFMHSDGHDYIHESLKAVERVYLRLKHGIIEGRSISEIITEIYEQRPTQNARRAVFLYLMRKATFNNCS